MKVVIISGFFPYPAHFGGAFDVLERIKAIKSLGHQIDLVCTCKDLPEERNIDYIKQFVNELIIIPRKNKIVNLFSKKPLQVISRKSLKTVLLKEIYDFAILESEYVGMILENPNFKSNQIIVRVHNNESEYFYQLAKSTKKYSDKKYYSLEALKFKLYSKEIFRKADKLWFISQKEINNIQNEFKSKSRHLPTSSVDTFLNQKLANKTVLFIGALFMPNNIEAIKWYLKNVHVFLINDKDYKLVVVGSMGDSNPKIVQDILKDYSNVEVLFNQEDLAPYYSNATVFINPMLHGAGVKLKSINAIRNGLILVSSSIGVEGTGLIKNEMYLEADSPKDFLAAVLKAFDMKSEEKQKMVNNAQNFLDKDNQLSILENEIQYEKE